MKGFRQLTPFSLCLDLEFLLRRKEPWRTILRNVLFKPGDIVENGEKVA